MRNKLLIGRIAILALTLLVGLMAFIGTGAANGQSLSDATQGATVIFSGGTNNPDAIGMREKLDSRLIVGADEIQEIHTPQQFGPFIGDTPYDESRRIGGDTMRTEVLEVQQAGEDKVLVVGYSQSASENSGEFAQMAGEGLSLNNVTAVSIANPRTPGTGIESRLAGMSLPGVTAMGPAPVVVKEYNFCHVQDPVGNAPEAGRLLDPLVLWNTLSGYFRYHGQYDNVDFSTARSYERDGVTYVIFDDGKTPVIEDVHAAGVVLPEGVENAIKDHVKVSDPGPGPAAPAVEQAPVAVSAPVASVTAELPLVTPAAATPDAVVTAQEWLPSLAQAGQEFIESVVQQPVWTPTPDAYTPSVPDQVEQQVNTAIDSGVAAVKNDAVLQQVIPPLVVDQVATDLHNLVGQFMN